MDSAGRTQAFQAWEQLDGEWRMLGFGGAVAVGKGGGEGHGASQVTEQLPAGAVVTWKGQGQRHRSKQAHVQEAGRTKG